MADQSIFNKDRKAFEKEPADKDERIRKHILALPWPLETVYIDETLFE